MLHYYWPLISLRTTFLALSACSVARLVQHLTCGGSRHRQCGRSPRAAFCFTFIHVRATLHNYRLPRVADNVALVLYLRLSQMFTAASSGFMKKKKSASIRFPGHVFHGPDGSPGHVSPMSLGGKHYMHRQGKKEECGSLSRHGSQSQVKHNKQRNKWIKYAEHHWVYHGHQLNSSALNHFHRSTVKVGKNMALFQSG